MRCAALALVILIPTSLLAQQAPPLVAPTNAQSPADERKAFTVPAGFDVQLVASEPDIQKPIQMAFDAKGRLWVTTSYHYPFAAPAGKGTDKLFILSDIDPATGKAGKVQVFADDLNIPIGILPLPDCKSCIVSSVGEIRKYTDTNDDGKADKMEVLFTGFGTRDTHGMYNSFTLMPDGWVYACHGYLNTSKVKGKDGHEVEMNSGNTFRFRPDGSRIEVYTRGQVNPFGIAIDPWFNLYTADCHSKPITQLIPGAYYDSFGKPHDGLGFAPHVTHHDHGSTALCGLSWYDADQFPKEYRGCMFLGNVVTNRINFDKIEWHGSTPVAKEQPDFLVSKDLWFRPTDIKLGPDGALYVADFYNKIIGHYEVDLKHPQRDHDHGRVWRIVWKGEGAKPAKMAFGDLTKEKPEELVKLLEHSNLAVRLAAANQFPTRKQGWYKAFQKGEMDAGITTIARVYASYPMLAEANNVFDQEVDWYGGLVPVFLVTDDEPACVELAAGIAHGLATRNLWGEKTREIVAGSLKVAAGTEKNELKASHNPIFHRAIVDAVIFHPHADFVAPLVELLKKCPADDTHLRHAARIALRNCLRDDEKAWPADAKAADPIIAEVALAIPSEKAAGFLFAQIKNKAIPGGKLAAAAEHIARNGMRDELKPLIETLTKDDTAPLPADAILAAFRGVQARGNSLAGAPVELIMAATHREITSLNNLDAPNPNDLHRVTAALRVLAAFRPVVDRLVPPKALKLSGTSLERLTEIIGGQKLPTDLRVLSAGVMLQYAPETALKLVQTQLLDSATSSSVRERFMIALASSTNREARLEARDALKDVPYRTAIAVGTALAGSPAGAADLLDAVKQGKAPARLLQEKVILERLRAARIAGLDRQVAALTKGLPPLDQKIAALMKNRASAFASAKHDKELGAKLFTKHCAACHKIGDMGGKIAPNLDGVGIRGLERILEDVLDPNRNVDQAFRSRIITTKDEQTLTGLMLRVEGEVVVLADAEGKEVRVPTKEIATNRETMLSPMPANFGDTIPEADFHHLMAYLLDQKVKDPPKK